MTPEQAAIMLKCSPRRIRYLIRKDKKLLPAHGKSPTYIGQDDIERWQQRRCVTRT